MEPARRLIERADPDAVTTATGISNPELEAFLRVNIPLVCPAAVGDSGSFSRRLAKGDSPSRAFFGTPLASVAELPDAEFDGPIRDQRQIGEHLTDPDPGAELLRDQKAVAPKLAQTGIDGKGSAQGSIVATGDSFITQAPNIMSQRRSHKCHH